LTGDEPDVQGHRTQRPLTGDEADVEGHVQPPIDR
jgi:hypothetical protein